MGIVLGIDVSTSCTAFALVRKIDGQLIKEHSISFGSKSKYPTLHNKANAIEEYLRDLTKEYDIERIYIETPLMNFKFGNTSAQTLSLLHRFNGIVSHICFQVFDKVPEHINASSARKSVGLKSPKLIYRHSKSVSDTKKKVLEHIASIEPAFKPLTGASGVVKVDCYDRADAIVIAKAGATLCRTNN